MIKEPANLPKVSLRQADLIRMVVVGIFVVLALSRVVPDFIRVAYPLKVFGYSTNADGVVTNAATPSPSAPAKPVESAAPAKRLLGKLKAAFTGENRPALRGDRPLVGDRIRIDRIKPFDRKPGLVGTRIFTYDNPDRFLPIERHGRERVLHLIGREETTRTRFFDMLRILLFVAAVGLGAMLFLVRPSIATAAFFVYCLGAMEAPSTYIDIVVPQPWRPIPEWIGNTLRGAFRPALLLFALCLIDGDTDAPRERAFAWVTGGMALALGTLTAYGDWSMHYGALPAEQLFRVLKDAGYCVSAMIVVAMSIAFLRAQRNDRHRIGWIAAAFAFAGGARLLSDTLYPGHIALWLNSILVSMSIVPIVTIWIAVVRHQFFNVDFVVNRAVVYVALTAGVIGTISVTEEVGTYLFYQNTDFAYGWLIAVSMAVGAFTGKIKNVLDRLVDRFIFRDRLRQREALEFIAGYILDAETVEDVYRALLQDAAHALQLSFGGILARKPDGSYELAANYDWPPDCVIRLGPDDDLTRTITALRGALSFSGKDTRLIQESFPNERLAFAAPLFYDRIVSGIVVYGHNVSGLDLDPEERELLVRVVAHASIALNAIELSKYRAELHGENAPSTPPTYLVDGPAEEVHAPLPSAQLPGTG